MTLCEYEKIDQLWNVLKRAPPHGFTVKEVAERANVRRQQIANRLGKLAMYGMIEREKMKVPNAGRRMYRYRLRKP